MKTSREQKRLPIRIDKLWTTRSSQRPEKLTVCLYAKFGGVLDKVAKQLGTATRTIEDAGIRTRSMEKKLRAVEQMNPIESAAVLALPIAALMESEETEEDEVGAA